MIEIKELLKYKEISFLYGLKMKAYRQTTVLVE